MRSDFVAMVLDGLDGRVARMTNTQSAFGAEYDSMSDMVAFGVAPALLSYKWALYELGNVGLTVVLFMLLVQHATGTLQYAMVWSTNAGLSATSPAAAGVVAAWSGCQ